MPPESRLDRMIEIAREYDVSLDDVVAAMDHLGVISFRALSESASTLPKYIKSKVNP